MKKAPIEPVLAQPGAYRQVFRDGETVLLTAAARWPRLAEASPGLRRVTRYYNALAARWRRWWEGPLLERARAAAGPETPPWSASMDFTVTLFSPDLLSLFIDIVEETGSRPRRVRLGDVWALPSGVPLELKELLARRRWRSAALETVRAQVEERVSSGDCLYYEDWPRLVSARFSPQRFYLTGEGPVVFYPPEAIAPALEGFPTFSLASLCPAGSPPTGAETSPRAVSGTF